MIELRAHHLLCTVLYKGKGYSQAFTDNMDRVVGKLKKPETVVMIKESPDNICNDCPNAKEDGSCALDDETKEANGDIVSLDRKVLEQFGLLCGTKKTAGELFSIAERKMTRDFFDECCGECRWHAAGLCSYDEYLENVKKLV